MNFLLSVVLVIGLAIIANIKAQDEPKGNILHYVYDNSTEDSPKMRWVYLTKDEQYMLIEEIDSNLTGLFNGKEKIAYVIENANFKAYKLREEDALDTSQQTAIEYAQEFGNNHKALEEKLTKAKENAKAIDIKEPSEDEPFFEDGKKILKQIITLSNPGDIYQFIFALNMMNTGKDVLKKLYFDTPFLINEMSLDEYDRYHNFLILLWGKYKGGWLALKEKGAKIDFRSIYAENRHFEVGSLKIIEQLGKNIDILKEFEGTESPILDIVKTAGGIAKSQKQC